MSCSPPQGRGNNEEREYEENFTSILRRPRPERRRRSWAQRRVGHRHRRRRRRRDPTQPAGTGGAPPTRIPATISSPATDRARQTIAKQLKRHDSSPPPLAASNANRHGNTVRRRLRHQRRRHDGHADRRQQRRRRQQGSTARWLRPPTARWRQQPPGTQSGGANAASTGTAANLDRHDVDQVPTTVPPTQHARRSDRNGGTNINGNHHDNHADQEQHGGIDWQIGNGTAATTTGGKATSISGQQDHDDLAESDQRPTH